MAQPFLAKVSFKAHDVFFTGIVGAGVGGASAAFFLKELFGGKVKIDIFEKDHVGGRLAPITISGHNYNAGGSIIHPANLYMVNFTDLLGNCTHFALSYYSDAI